MAIGACVGRVIGIFVQYVQNAVPDLFIFASCKPDVECVTPGTYAILGAAAALAGVTRMTISLAVIMFELTGALSFLLPIMITVLISKWVGDLLVPKGLYDSLIDLNGYPFLNPEETKIKHSLSRDVMTSHDTMSYLRSDGHTLTSLEELIVTLPFKGYPILDSKDNTIIGFIGRSELLYAIGKIG